MEWLLYDNGPRHERVKKLFLKICKTADLELCFSQRILQKF